MSSLMFWRRCFASVGGGCRSRMTLAFGLGMVWVLFACGSAFAAETGSISGQVTDTSGVPLKTICVNAYDSGGVNVAYTYTKSDGTYTVDWLEAGSYRLRFSDCGDNNVFGEYYSGKSTLAAADAVTVTVGSDSPGIDAQMTVIVAGSISGKVTDAFGTPLKDICVDALVANGPYGPSTKTIMSGTYTVDGLEPGSYRLRFSDCGDNNVFGEYYSGKSTLAAADAVTVTVGSDTPGIDAQMTVIAAGSISGKVTNASGLPLERICIEAYSLDGFSVGHASTDSNGTYTIDVLETDSWLQTGSFRLRFSDCGDNNALTEYYSGKSTLAAADAVTVTAGSDTPGIDAQMTVIAAGSISGKVTNTSGTPLKSVCVNAYDSDGYSMGHTSTESDGTYTVNRLQTGSYRVGFGCGMVREYFSGKLTLAAANAVTVTADSDTPNIDARLPGLGSLSGSTWGRICVSVYDMDGKVVGNDYVGEYEETYEIGGLRPGNYRVAFADCRDKWGKDTGYYDNKPSLATANVVTVTAGSDTPNIVGRPIEHKPSSISGKVTGRSGTPLSGMCVDAFDSDGYGYTRHGNFPYESNSYDEDGTRTSMTGSYSMQLPPDDYRVRFSDCMDRDGGRFAEYYSGKSTLATANTVTVIWGFDAPNIDGQVLYAPTAEIDSGPSGTIGVDEATFLFSGVPADITAKVQCKLDDGDWGDCVSPRTFTGLSDGEHTVVFRAEDAAGNGYPYSASRTFVVDTTPPDTVIDSGPSGTVSSNEVTFKFGGDPAGDTAKVQCKLDAGAWEDCVSPRTFTGLSDGEHTVVFRAEDAAGNRDETPASRTFMVDTTVPDPPGPSAACVAAKSDLGVASRMFTIAKRQQMKANRMFRNTKKPFRNAKKTFRIARKSGRALMLKRAKKRLRAAKRNVVRSKKRAKLANRKTRIARQNLKGARAVVAETCA